RGSSAGVEVFACTSRGSSMGAEVVDPLPVLVDPPRYRRG
ncbi:MAG: hypothetical protein K0Q93_2100, partial [Nocardioidaceae bacterium]|nr:hypothetical protein [Nocardioidaceae bacterium]